MKTMATAAEALANPRGKLIAVDVDGTLCEGVFWGDTEPKPIQPMIDKVWEWYKAGAHIVIYTGRQPRYYPETLSWLVKHRVPFHGIAMQVKIGADVYIDDRALQPKDVL
jgi:hypothetical protein